MLVGIGFGWTGVGLLVAANGADDAWAGIATMYYGKQVHTLKYRALYVASDGNETVATIGEIGIGFASGAAVSKLNHLAKLSKQAQQAGNVGEAVVRTADNAVETLNSADNFAVSAASQSPVKRYGIGDQLPTIQCFAPDTLVDTPQGKRRIDEIRENDLVFAFDFASGQWVERPVEVCHRNFYQGSLIEISTKHGSIVATAYHPCWVLEGYDLANRPRPRKLADTEDEDLALRGRWVNSHDLMAGDLIYSTEGRELRVLKIVQTYEEQFEVCNLTIAENHSFAVGNDGVLVHNTGGCGDAARVGGLGYPGSMPRTANSAGRLIYGPHYDEAVRLLARNADFFPDPNAPGSRIVQGSELAAARREYKLAVRQGDVPKGHHRLGLLFGGEPANPQNIVFTGESTIRRSLLKGLNLDFYVQYGKSDADVLKVHQATPGGILQFGPNPLHTEATNFQNKVRLWQEAQGLRTRN
jgi:hypothetical protein